MVTILTGDALEKLRELPDESVQCCVTSPPYWGLRDYGTAQWEGGDEGCDHLNVTRLEPAMSTLGGGKDVLKSEGFYRDRCKCGAKRIDAQLGLEKTPEIYVQRMVEVFREVRRVLRKDGTLWLNLGDSYASSRDSKSTPDTLRGDDTGTATTFSGNRNPEALKLAGLKHKDLCGIPWRVAFALQADGWWLRSDIIWAKPNPMPESCTDRPTKSHEYIFLLTRSANYFYDAEAIKEKLQSEPHAPGNLIGNRSGGQEFSEESRSAVWGANGSRNKRSVWNIATSPYPDAHFATFPPEIPKLCILAGTSAKGCCAKCGAPWKRIVERDSPIPWTEDTRGVAGKFSESHQPVSSDKPDGQKMQRWLNEHPKQTLGWQPTCGCATVNGSQLSVIPCTVLDPFAGSGTTGTVALELGRKAVLIELNPKYVELIKQRCDVTPGLALA